jgi:sepiapterin reductase
MLLVVTGASRGFGRSIAKIFSQQEGVDTITLVLIARSSQGLEQTADLVQKTTPATKVTCLPMDLSSLDELDPNLDQLFSVLDDITGDRTTPSRTSSFDSIVLINNAGTVGHVGPSIETPTLAGLRSNVDLNITSALWISVRFARYCIQRRQQAILVNLSSLVAIADFPSMACYSAGKAAREKYHTIMSQELQKNTSISNGSQAKIKILNYAPGPLETDMVTEIRSSASLDESLKPSYDKPQLNPDDSSKKLIMLLLSNDFESGAHIDYYDLPDP